MTTGEQLPNTANEFLIGYGKNLPNHSESMRGRAGFIRQGVSGIPIFRTREQAFRYAAHLAAQAELLPHEEEDEPFTFEQVLNAVRSA